MNRTVDALVQSPHRVVVQSPHRMKQGNARGVSPCWQQIGRWETYSGDGMGGGFDISTIPYPPLPLGYHAISWWTVGAGATSMTGGFASEYDISAIDRPHTVNADGSWANWQPVDYVYGLSATIGQSQMQNKILLTGPVAGWLFVFPDFAIGTSNVVAPIPGEFIPGGSSLWYPVSWNPAGSYHAWALAFSQLTPISVTPVNVIQGATYELVTDHVSFPAIALSAFVYGNSPLARILSVSPSSGGNTGSGTITGINLVDYYALTLGGTPVASTYINSTTIDFTYDTGLPAGGTAADMDLVYTPHLLSGGDGVPSRLAFTVTAKWPWASVSIDADPNPIDSNPQPIDQ